MELFVKQWWFISTVWHWYSACRYLCMSPFNLKWYRKTYSTFSFLAAHMTLPPSTLLSWCWYKHKVNLFSGLITSSFGSVLWMRGMCWTLAHPVAHAWEEQLRLLWRRESESPAVLGTNNWNETGSMPSVLTLLGVVQCCGRFKVTKGPGTLGIDGRQCHMPCKTLTHQWDVMPQTKICNLFLCENVDQEF